MRLARCAKALLVALVVHGLVPEMLLACPTCYGAPDSAMTQGMNFAILSLLAITGSVLGGFVAFFLYMRKRTHEMSNRFTNILN